jgi:ABC-type sugar transport system ATPase subunit
MTSIFVTHDQTEAMTLADRIVCLDAGRIAQVGTPEELYNAPANTFVAGFIGAPQINLIPAVVADGVLRFADGQHLPFSAGSADPGGTRPVLVGLRPEDLSDAARASPQAPRLTVEVLLSETLGSDTFVLGNMAGQRVTARCTPGLRPQPGTRMALAADITRLHLFDPETRLRL